MPKRKSRDIEQIRSTKAFVNKLRRLADHLEQDKPYVIQIAGERVRMPGHAYLSIEHARDGSEEEIEFQIKWTKDA